MTEALSIGGVAALLLYLALILAVGLLAYRRTQSLDDYILGGRRLGPFVAALSAGASDMSGWLLMGLPGAIYLAGLNQIWIGIGLTIGAYFNWRLLAPRLRAATIELKALPLPDYLEARFEDRSRMLRIAAASVILVFFTIYVASGLVAGGKLFAAAFGWPYHMALLAGLLVVGAYTIAGGFLAVSWTDAIQGTLMLAALIGVPALAVVHLGGFEPTWEAAQGANAASFEVFHEITPFALLSMFAWGLGYFGQPHILARFMAIERAKDVAHARRIAMSWMVLSLIGAVLTGLAGIATFAADPLPDGEQVLILLSNLLLHPFVAGMVAAAILAAVMSTIDSQLLVSSSALTEDFYRALVRPAAGERELVWVGRGAVLTIAIIAAAIALDESASILGLVSYAWAGFGAAFGPVLLFGLYWPQTTREGALAGMITGAVVVMFWPITIGLWIPLYELLPGFVLAASAVYGVSRRTGKPAFGGDGTT